MEAAILGVGLGMFVAAQPGPVTLLLIRTLTRGHRRAAWSVGAAAAMVDTLYAAAGAAGMAPLLRIDAVRLVFGLVGAGVLILIGARTLWSAWRVRSGMELPAEVETPWRAFATGVGATATNPLTIVSWAAIFAAASVSGAATGTVGAVVLIVAIGLGSLLWFTIFTVAAGWLVRRTGDRWTSGVEIGSGVGLVGFGGWLGWHSTTS